VTPTRLAYFAFVRVFRLLERWGAHLTPNHFYFPIPDTGRLPMSIWAVESDLVGVDMRVTAQIALLDDLVRFRPEYERFARRGKAPDGGFSLDNPQFGPVDAEVLYALIRSRGPRTVLEVGSGYSTQVSRAALDRNARDDRGGRLVSIEPYPGPALRQARPDELIQAPVQSVPLDRFAALGDTDILFIDSSHVAKVGSDVTYEVLEILPRLRPGVLVHFHDIFLPREYPRSWVVNELRFYNEQYLVQAFLSFNSAFEVIWSGHLMHLRHPDVVAAAFPSYADVPNVPGSLWVRRRS
jgi:predicted O-methyltransferase YrrM